MASPRQPGLEATRGQLAVDLTGPDEHALHHRPQPQTHRGPFEALPGEGGPTQCPCKAFVTCPSGLSRRVSAVRGRRGRGRERPRRGSSAYRIRFRGWGWGWGAARVPGRELSHPPAWHHRSSRVYRILVVRRPGPLHPPHRLGRMLVAGGGTLLAVRGRHPGSEDRGASPGHPSRGLPDGRPAGCWASGSSRFQAGSRSSPATSLLPGRRPRPPGLRARTLTFAR